MKDISAGLWIIDTRHPESPYGTVFFHDSQLPADFNPIIYPAVAIFLNLRWRNLPKKGIRQRILSWRVGLGDR